MKTQVSFYAGEIRNIASKGFFYLFTAQGFIIVLGFATQFFVAGFLDPTDIGRIKIMQTYINLAVLICGLGFETSLLKLVAESNDLGEKRKIYQMAFLATSISFVVIYSLVSALTFLGLLSTDAVISRFFPLYFLFLLPLALQNIQLAYYQANMKIKTMAKLQFALKTISIFLIITFTFLYQLKGYIFVIVLTGFLSSIVLELGIKNIRFKASYFRIDFKLLSRMWNLAKYALIANVVGTLAATLDIYMINYLVSDRKEVGYYMFALTILSVYQLFPLTIQQIAFPFFSQQSSDYEKWHRSYVKYNQMNHILMIVVSFLGVLFIPFLVKLAFSGKYDSSAHYFIILSFAWMVKSSTVIKATATMGYGRFDINFMASSIILVLSFPITFLSIKHYGLNGAVAAMVITSVISYFTVTYVFRRFNRTLAS